MSRCPTRKLENVPRSRALAREKMRCGRHEDARHSRALVTAAVASCWPMIAHAPVPSAASTTAPTVPTSAPMTVIVSSLRNCISRSSSDCCVAPSAVSRNEADSAASSGPADGSS